MRHWERVYPLVLGLAAFLAVWIAARPLSGGPGLTWDEAYYYPTFVDVAGWVALAAGDPGLALSPEGIRAGWEEINELPPVAKWLGAMAVSIAPGQGWNRLWIMRLVPAAAFGFTIWLMYLIGLRLGGRICGILATCLYMMLPRVFAHAQIAATETIFSAVVVLTMYVAIHDLSRWKWRVVLVLATGLALATKVNGIILIAVIVFWLLTRDLLAGPWKRAGFHRALISDGIAVALVALAAPVVAWLIWPWMWDQTVQRLYGYHAFIREHSHQGLWFAGTRYNFPPGVAPMAPGYYPVFIAHLTMPVWALVAFWLAVVGGIMRLAQARRIRSTPYLVALLTIAPVVASSLPSSPKYDGIRLFFPAFAPAALLASIGCLYIVRRIAGRTRVLSWTCGSSFQLIKSFPFLLLLVQLLVLRPALDFYNAPTRWMVGDETVFPFEQTYWGNAIDAGVVADLNATLPPGARVKTLAIQPATFAILRDWGVLRDDIVFNGDPPYDVHLMQNRRGFWGNAEWSIYTTREPLATWGMGSGGEPLVFLYDGRPPGSD